MRIAGAGIERLEHSLAIALALADDNAIAHLKQTHQLYPELGLLTQSLNSGEDTLKLKA